MSFFLKPITEISFFDIKDLVLHKTRETYDLDYKLCSLEVVIIGY